MNHPPGLYQFALPKWMDRCSNFEPRARVKCPQSRTVDESIHKELSINEGTQDASQLNNCSPNMQLPTFNTRKPGGQRKGSESGTYKGV